MVANLLVRFLAPPLVTSRVPATKMDQFKDLQEMGNPRKGRPLKVLSLPSPTFFIRTYSSWSLLCGLFTDGIINMNGIGLVIWSVSIYCMNAVWMQGKRKKTQQRQRRAERCRETYSGSGRSRGAAAWLLLSLDRRPCPVEVCFRGSNQPTAQASSLIYS
jgi:hypothetical protein